MKRELDFVVTQMRSSGLNYAQAVREFKRCYIQAVLAANNGNQCKAARELVMHRNTLSRTMTELELDPAQIKMGLKRPAGSARLSSPLPRVARF